MGKKPPLEGLIVLPCRVLGLDQKTFVVIEDVGDHYADKSEEKIFRTQPSIGLEIRRNGRHGSLRAENALKSHAIMQSSEWRGRESRAIRKFPK